jgi:CRISPR/Cas system-associated exonuclease Cas4 (RecB family)
LIKISYSRASCYLECPQKHYFRYIMLLRSKKIFKPLTFGKDFHTLLQHRDKTEEILSDIKDTYYSMNTQAQETLGDSYLDDLAEIYNDYCTVWADSEPAIETEHEFLVPLAKYKKEPVYFHGIIDEIYEDNSLGEHKTFSQMPNMSVLAMNLQVCLYAKAYQKEFGITPTKVRWDYIRSTPSKQPIWLDKSKRFSEANNSNITPMSWLRACKERGISDPVVLAKAKQYEHNIPNFFFRCTTEIVPEMINVSWDSFKLIAKDIVTRGGDNQVKNISRNCSFCEYQPICYSQFTGANTKYVIDTDYVIKEE